MGAPLKKTILVLVALLALLPASLSQRADCSAVEDDTGGMGIQPAVGECVCARCPLSLYMYIVGSLVLLYWLTACP